MARVKISEWNAKKSLIPTYIGLPATIKTTESQITELFPDTNLVVKVDQGIKKRGKLGLVKVNVTPKEIPSIIKNWAAAGWSHFLIEPVIEHAESAERYLTLERVRTGWQVSYSEKGGIDVESSWESVKSTVMSLRGLTLKDEPTSTDIFKSREGQTLKEYIVSLLPLLDQHHVSFLEMNPIVIRGGNIIPLDMACEVDSAGSTLPTIENTNVSQSEKEVAVLDAATPASLKFKLINEDGTIWVLLSGGGASLVLADEVADQGMGEMLANYGEYSGAPTDDDVYAYTSVILKQMLTTNPPRAGKSSRKAIIIAGGVANFTDVVKTFKGIIRALDENKAELVQANVKVFVRRGGPNEKKGLAMMQSFLKQSNLLGAVHGHDIALTQVVSDVKEYLQ